MRRFVFTFLSLIGLLALPASGSLATELVYQPVNPSFGGYPANGTFLLALADAQNTIKDPEAAAYQAQNPLNSFSDTLNRRILSILAEKIVNTAFGDTTSVISSGQYVVGDYIIDVDTSNGVTVVISDPLTGGSTTVSIPNF